jgi:hypothetical protein
MIGADFAEGEMARKDPEQKSGLAENAVVCSREVV